jgi:hypothetical protein
MVSIQYLKTSIIACAFGSNTTKKMASGSDLDFFFDDIASVDYDEDSSGHDDANNLSEDP